MYLRISDAFYPKIIHPIGFDPQDIFPTYSEIDTDHIKLEL